MEKYSVKAKVQMEVELIVVRSEKPNKNDIIDYVNESLNGYVDVDSVVVSEFAFQNIDGLN